jgi:hypothetical protein
VVHWCDGSALPIKLPSSTIRRIQGFPGCMMQVSADAPCAGQSPYHTPKQSPKRSLRAKKDGAPAALSSNTGKPPLKPRDYRTVSGSKASDRAASAAQDAKVPASTNSMHAGTGPPRSSLAAIPPNQDTALTQPKTGQRTSTQIAVFPEASEYDWTTLLCNQSGQSLIRQTDALLGRRAVLQTMLGDLRFSSDAVEKLEEWIAAEKEVEAINRELDKFRGRARAIINKSASN